MSKKFSRFYKLWCKIKKYFFYDFIMKDINSKSQDNRTRI